LVGYYLVTGHSWLKAIHDGWDEIAGSEVLLIKKIEGCRNL